MSETDWRELSTAPTDVVVRLGKWDLFCGKLEWRETMGAPWEAGWFGRRKPTWYGREYTHWLPAPPPPKSEVAQ